MDVLALYVIVPLVCVFALLTRQRAEIREIKGFVEPNLNLLGLDLMIGSEEAFSMATYKASQDKLFFKIDFSALEEEVVRNLDPLAQEIARLDRRIRETEARMAKRQEEAIAEEVNRPV